MKIRTVYPICFLLLLLASSCDHSDRKEAQEKADRAGQKVQELGRKATEQAEKLGEDVQSSVDSGMRSDAGQNAKAKLKQGGRDLEAAGEEASRKLDKAALITKIKARLAADAGLTAAASVKVEVSGQVATLTGTVESEAQKSQAVAATAKVPGIIRVVDNLQVR